MKYDVAVVGAGIAGLFAALKLSLSGKKVILIDKLPVAGGFATSFTRKCFTFESSLHCVSALGIDGEIRQYLEEVGLNKKVSFIELNDFCRIIYPEHDFVADFKIDNFIKFLQESFPKEKENIGKLFLAFDKFYIQADRYLDSHLPTCIKLLISPLAYPAILQASVCTIEQFINRYISDKKLKGIITDIWRFIGTPPERLSAFYFLMVFRGYYYKPTAYVKGGFAKLFASLAAAIKDNGGDVRFNTAIERFITDKKKLQAVITEKKEEFSIRAAVSNVNAIDTLCNLLDDKKEKQYYHSKLSGLEKSVSAFQVYLGLKIPAKDLGMNCYMFSINTSYNHKQNLEYCLKQDYEKCLLQVVDHAQLDPSLVPVGKGSLSVMVFDLYSNWKGLTGEDYKRKKTEVANKLLMRLEKYLPGITGNIEIIEIATPLTMAKYGVSPEGAIYGFSQTVDQAGINRLAQKTRIRGLFLAGAWTHPGAGAHACFLSGIDAADLALKFLKNKN